MNIKHLITTIYTCIVIVIFNNLALLGQSTITLDEALVFVKENNPQLKALHAREAMELSLTKAVHIMAPMQLSSVVGQFNSAYFDHLFSVSQEFSAPGYFKAKKNWQQQKLVSASAYKKWMEAELALQLEKVFIHYSYISEKEKILKQKDSLFSLFLERASVRVDLGDADVMAKIIAEQQKFHTTYLLASNQQELAEIKIEFNKLLGGDDNYNMVSFPLHQKRWLLDFTSASNLEGHPELDYLYQEIQLASLSTKLEKANYYPTLSLGYQNTSIRGTGADNKTYRASDRFSSVVVGVNIPLSRQGIRHQIQASRLHEESLMYQLEYTKLDKESSLQKAYSNYQNEINQMANFEKELLPGLIKIQEIGQSSLEGGQASFFEYVLLLNQAFDLRFQYLELQLAARTEEANIHYLLTK